MVVAEGTAARAEIRVEDIAAVAVVVVPTAAVAVEVTSINTNNEDS
jgi:hypothetical protein